MSRRASTLSPFQVVWSCGACPDAFRETDAQASEEYFMNPSYLNGFWSSHSPQETSLLKVFFFPPSVAGVSHSSEVRRRTGGETKAKGSNHVLSLGELEQRRRPGIRGNWLGHWVTRGHPVAILQGKNKDLSSLH